MTTGFPLPRGIDELSVSVRRALQGKINSIGEITLTANAASTVLTNVFLSPQSVLVLDPQTANAAAELGNGTLYTLSSDRGSGSWTMTHANNAQADRTFSFAILG